MATYVNNLRLKEIATGDESGTWGTSTNTNLELIGQALGYGAEDLGSDANATLTMADGTDDDFRAMFLKITSSVSLTATRTITFAPNTVSKLWFVENATSGAQDITISQGSGANVTIPSGYTSVIYTDGAGSGASVVDATASLAAGGVLYIDEPNGYVGFGTTAPDTATHVLTANDVALLLESSDATAGIAMADSNGGVRILTTGTGQMVFYTGGDAGTAENVTEYMRLDASGRLLINASSGDSDDKVTVATSSGVESVTIDGQDNSANAYFRINVPGNRRGAVVWEENGTSRFTMERGDDDNGNADSLYLHPGTPDGGTFTEGVRMDKDGNFRHQDVLFSGPVARYGISRTYTASTSSDDLFDIVTNTGFLALECTAILRDTGFPAGSWIEKLYIATRGSGTAISSIALTQENKERSASGSLTGYGTWAASVASVNSGSSNAIRLSYTATAASGSAVVYLLVEGNGIIQVQDAP